MTAFSNLRAANAARQAEWDAGGEISLTFRATEMAGEVGEACNVIKKLERERLGIRGSRATVQDLADELADVVICADLIAMGEGIDLDAAVASKFNATSEKVGLATRLVAIPPIRPAAQAVLTERARQVLVEGFTREHDDGHVRGEIAMAASAYALMGAGDMAGCEGEWPVAWGACPAPVDRRRALVRAGALIIAEIERLDRKAAADA